MFQAERQSSLLFNLVMLRSVKVQESANMCTCTDVSECTCLVETFVFYTRGITPTKIWGEEGGQSLVWD